MSRKATTQELKSALEEALNTLPNPHDLSQPNLYLCPRLVDCNGSTLTVELEYDTKSWMSNPMGVVHGGILASMLDTSMGLTCHGIVQIHTPTISMNIHYARPVPLNQTVRVRTTAFMAGSTTIQLQAQLYLPAEPERILVSASGIYDCRGK